MSFWATVSRLTCAPTGNPVRSIIQTCPEPGIFPSMLHPGGRPPSPPWPQWGPPNWSRLSPAPDILFSAQLPCLLRLLFCSKLCCGSPFHLGAGPRSLPLACSDLHGPALCSLSDFCPSSLASFYPSRSFYALQQTHCSLPPWGISTGTFLLRCLWLPSSPLSRLGHKRHFGFSLSALTLTSSRGSQLPCCRTHRHVTGSSSSHTEMLM